MTSAYLAGWSLALQWAFIVFCLLPALLWAASAVSKRSKERRAHAKARDPLRNTKMYVLCVCGHPFVPGVKFGAAICPHCSHFVNVSGAKFFSLNEYNAMLEEQDFLSRHDSPSEADATKLMELALFHGQKGRYRDALECLDRIDALPGLDPKMRELVATLRSNYQRDLARGR